MTRGFQARPEPKDRLFLPGSSRRVANAPFGRFEEFLNDLKTLIVQDVLVWPLLDGRKAGRRAALSAFRVGGGVDGCPGLGRARSSICCSLGPASTAFPARGAGDVLEEGADDGRRSCRGGERKAEKGGSQLDLEP